MLSRRRRPEQVTEEASAARGIADRLAAGRPPQGAGRLLLVAVITIAVVAHVPDLAPVAMSLALVITLFSALWTSGPAGYAFVVTAQLVQLTPAPTRGQLAAVVIAAIAACGAVRLTRAMTSLVTAAQRSSLRQYGARDELARRSRIEQAELSGQVAYWASHDRLTHVLNRTAMNQHIGALTEAGTPCSILVISLANFSAVNEALGSDVGDECLAALAGRLRARARETDLVARLGGDDFAVVLPGLALEHAAAVARRLLQVLDDPFAVGAHKVLLHARSGLAIAGDRPMDGPGELVRRASLAARSAPVGGAAAVFTAETQADHEAALVLEADLHQALERDELFLLYQPLVSTTTGRIESVEALVRWQHPVRGLVPPDEFIGAAERSGQIVGIGMRVLEMAVAQLKAWSSGPGSLLTVAVNVSARQLSEPGFVDQVQSVVWAAGVDPHRVILELTESLLVEDSEAAIACLWRLRGLGFRLALDDFGTGYSSLARLGELPLDELKIDKSFVDRLGAGPTDSTALVTAAIAMGHGLGLTVVAEGVETQLQAAQLASLSCDLLQGYLLGKPQTVEALSSQIGQRLLPEQAAIPAPRAHDQSPVTATASADVLPAGHEPARIPVEGETYVPADTPMFIPQLVPDGVQR